MRIVVATLALVLVTGCSAPSPEKVCKHVMELAEKDGDKPSEKKLDRCTEKLTKLKDKEPEQYKCMAPCAADAKSLDGLRDCEKKCKKDDKKKGDDDDDKGSKKKKSGDDDDDKGSKKKKTDDD
ncbi:MAG: hypothetical protein JNL79_08975 [Myxococcales bacterium]|nr:hypothetical protein [Myxococcales bacterium]